VSFLFPKRFCEDTNNGISDENPGWEGIRLLFPARLFHVMEKMDAFVVLAGGRGMRSENGV